MTDSGSSYDQGGNINFKTGLHQLRALNLQIEGQKQRQPQHDKGYWIKHQKNFEVLLYAKGKVEPKDYGQQKIVNNIKQMTSKFNELSGMKSIHMNAKTQEVAIVFSPDYEQGQAMKIQAQLGLLIRKCLKIAFHKEAKEKNVRDIPIAQLDGKKGGLLNLTKNGVMKGPKKAYAEYAENKSSQIWMDDPKFLLKFFDNQDKLNQSWIMSYGSFVNDVKNGKHDVCNNDETLFPVELFISVHPGSSTVAIIDRMTSWILQYDPDNCKEAFGGQLNKAMSYF